MMLKVQRLGGEPKIYEHGQMFLDNNYICETLEPGLSRPQHPAIPEGIYDIVLVTYGHVFDWMSNDLLTRATTPEDIKTANDFRQHGIPLLENVPNREGIEIHIANSCFPTEKNPFGQLLGCTGTGTTYANGLLQGSTKAYFKFYRLALPCLLAKAQIQYINQIKVS